MIDGALDDACWQTAGAIREMEDFMRVPGTEVQTTIMVCADADALYFGFDCREPATDALLAETAERDGPAWQDDSVELFLTRTATGAATTRSSSTRRAFSSTKTRARRIWLGRSGTGLSP